MNSKSLKLIIKKIDDYNENNKGFLPNKTPIIELEKPYDVIDEVCSRLPIYYHGEGKNCRDIINKKFEIVDSNWLNKIEELNTNYLESLMTKVSLICHAYRWKNMPASAELYRIDKIELPKNLLLLWEKLSIKLNIPMVGNFYTMVSNNWVIKNKKQNENYSVDELLFNNVDILHPWLDNSLESELKAFIIAALGAESQGENILQNISKAYFSILNNNEVLLIESLEEIKNSINIIVGYFNRSIKNSLIKSTNFLKYIQPTMIWLIDGIEGANGTQCCTIQALDSFLGVDRKTTIGKMITRSREYMLPKHLELLYILDESSNILENFVKKSQNQELKIIFNNCIKALIKWRKSHKNRGAMYMKNSSSNSIDNYISTGLAVPLDSNRDEIFKELMESHIKETKNKYL